MFYVVFYAIDFCTKYGYGFGETLSHHNKGITTGVMLELKLHEADNQFQKMFEIADSVHKDSIYDDQNNLIKYILSTSNSNGERIEYCLNFAPNGYRKSIENRVNDKIIFKKTYNADGFNVAEIFYTTENGATSFRHKYEYNSSDIVTLEKVYDSSEKLICTVEYTGDQLNKVVFKKYHYYSGDVLSYVIVEDFDGYLYQIMRYYYNDGKLDYTIVYNKKGKEIERITGG